MNNYEEIFRYINEKGIDFKKDEPMKLHTSFKIGGPARLFLNIESKKQLIEIIKIINSESINFFIIGNGSNLLVGDKGFDGIIIKLSGEFNDIRLISEDVIECGAAVPLSRLCLFAAKNSLSGLEFAFGIPGTVGGAVFMNAGAYDGEMKNVVEQVYHIEKDSCNEGIFKGNELCLSYRSSVYQRSNDIITKVVFKLKKNNYECIKGKMDDFLYRRKLKQPLEYPNAGSIFKRPNGNFAAALIDGCGLKGKSIGGAKISEKHSGFIINTGCASCEDVISLIDLIKDIVLTKYGVLLEREVEIIGNVD